LEKNPNKKKVRCKRCKGYGHFEKTCKLAEPEEDEAVETEIEPQNKSEAPQQKKKKKAPAKKAPAKKKGTPKKKKIPTKKKQKKNLTAPPPRVVRSLLDCLNQG
ncbi:hypothetical protein PVAP13_1NG325819, partial [Panicum virgatum]